MARTALRHGRSPEKHAGPGRGTRHGRHHAAPRQPLTLRVRQPVCSYTLLCQCQHSSASITR
eukprot:scaffold38796_cov65-Phaeocystis_antarctica.AAC.3